MRTLVPIVVPALIATAAAEPLALRRTAAGGWELVREGKPFFLRGAGGQRHLDVLAESGGNSIRTWGIDSLAETADGKPLVERARELNLTIAAGLWVAHERHGFNYSDPAQLEKQRQEIRAAVAKWKHEPSIGFWGLGNEMEGPTADGKDERIWKELEVLAKIVKEEDPSRLVMTVIAGAARPKIEGVKNHCPSIDILGVNAYASASGAGKAVKEAGWSKPFVLTEFGPSGHWEVAKTPWGAPIEPSSRDKAAKYFSTQQLVTEESSGLCVGSYAFLWGQKQECTATWYGMFLKSGEKLPSVDAMSRAWTDRWPANRCPRVETFSSPAKGGRVKPGQPVELTLDVADPNGDPVTLEWTLAAESTDRQTGGDAERAPEQLKLEVKPAGEKQWTFTAPQKPGDYRVFLVVRDGRGAASAENIPFQVR
jgi:hypothetical protein